MGGGLRGPVLVGADSGATLVATLVGEVDADAAVLAGLALPGATAATATWDDELDARSACPVHRSVIEGDAGFERTALGRPLPWSSLELTAPAKPVLVVHGAADAVSPAASTRTSSPLVASGTSGADAGVAVIVMVTVWPSASFICEATVRFQTRS